MDDAVAALAHEGLPVRNAVIEAFEIHARQLIEVLTHQRNRRHAVARDWAKAWSVSQRERDDLKILREAFSERVAHLSWKRAQFTAEEQQVLTHEIEATLRPLLLRFLDEADPENLCEGFIGEACAALSDDTPEPEHGVGVQRLDQIEVVTHVATTQAPRSNAGTATVTLRELTERGRGED